MADYHWRAVTEADLADLAALDAACRAEDGPVSVPGPQWCKSNKRTEQTDTSNSAPKLWRLPLMSTPHK